VFSAYEQQGIWSGRGILRAVDDIDRTGGHRPPPLRPRFDSEGNMIEMGQKLNGPLEGIVVVPPRVDKNEDKKVD
jgi:hypothetical protein